MPDLVVPQVGARIMDLQEPDKKMSTTSGSEAGTLYVLDEPGAIRKKLGSAVTDSGREVRRGEDKPGVTNLIDILAVARGVDPAEVEREFGDAGYGDFKAAVAEGVAELLAPRARALRPRCALTRRRSRRRSPPAPRRPARSPRRRSPRCASGWASARPSD